MSALCAGWLLTYLVHSTLLLAAAWLASRLLSDRQLALREALWRLALFGGLATATLQLATGVAPFAGSWSLGESERPAQLQPLAPAAAAGASLGASVAAPAAATEPSGPAVSTRDPRAWLRWLARGWATVGLTLLALLAISYLRFRWRLRSRTVLDDGDLPAFLARLQARAGARSRPRHAVRLTRSSRIGVPLARGVRRGEICLPREALERLPMERLEIVVAHELAHLRRRDPLWFGLARILERALFFQPFNALARRQLQEISEFRCDDWAVAVTRRPISLAKCLTEVAEWRVRGRSALPVPTMGAGRSHLSRRVARLLERSYPMPSETLPRWLTPAALAALLLTVLIAPGVSAHAPVSAEIASEPAAPAAPESTEPAPRPTAPPPPSIPALPAAPALAPPPPTPDLVDGLDPFEELGALGELAAELDAVLLPEILPMLAEISTQIEPALAAEQAELAAELAAGWTGRLEFDGEQVERLREMAHRIEERGHATEAEAARLAEMAERLIDTAKPSRERIEQMRERAREIAEAGRQAMEAHREHMLELKRSEAEALARARAEIRRSLEERRELLERARRKRAESLGESDREHHERLRREMLRSRDLLREQLRRLDRELERLDREGGPGERPEPLPE